MIQSTGPKQGMQVSYKLLPSNWNLSTFQVHRAAACVRQSDADLDQHRLPQILSEWSASIQVTNNLSNTTKHYLLGYTNLLSRDNVNDNNDNI